MFSGINNVTLKRDFIMSKRFLTEDEIDAKINGGGLLETGRVA